MARIFLFSVLSFSSPPPPVFYFSRLLSCVCVRERRTRGQGRWIESESESFVATKARESLLWQGRAMAGSRSSDRQRKQLRNGDSCVYPTRTQLRSTIRIARDRDFEITRYTRVRTDRVMVDQNTRKGGQLIFFFFFLFQKIPFLPSIISNDVSYTKCLTFASRSNYHLLESSNIYTISIQIYSDTRYSI